MQDQKVILITLISGIVGIVICVTFVLYKWFDSIYRNPDSNAKLNTVGYIMFGVIEPVLLFCLAMIYKALS